MLVDRHHVQYLIELGELARGKSASQLAAHEDRLEAFLGTLGGAASPSAIVAAEARMRRSPEDDRPWSAVRSPETGAAVSAPPAALLVLSQLDDDPDGEEDGNRLPPRGTPGWAPLHDALDRWDTDAILAWVGPLGWQPPSAPLLLDQDAELRADPTASPSGPTSHAEAASLAAREADARSQKTLRVIGTAAAGGVGALLFGLGRALGRAASISRTDIAKEPTS